MRGAGPQNRGDLVVPRQDDLVLHFLTSGLRETGDLVRVAGPQNGGRANSRSCLESRLQAVKD